MLNKIREEVSEYLEHLRLFSKNIKLFLFGIFFIGLGFSIFNLLFNLYLKELGFGEGFIGEVLSASSLGGAILAIPLALILPRIKIKRIIIIMPLLFFAALITQTYFTQCSIILISSFFKGLVFSAYIIIGGPFYMRNSSPKERTHIFAVSSALGLASGFIGNIVSGFIYKLSGGFFSEPVYQYRFTLSSGAFLSLLAIFFFLFLNTTNLSVAHHKKIIVSDFPLKFLLKVGLCQLIIGLGAGMLIPFLNLFFKGVWHIVPSKLGILFAVSQGFMFVGIILAPVLKKYVGMVKAVVITQLISIPFMFLLGYSKIYWLVVIAFFLRATFMNISQPLIVNFIMENVKERFQFIAGAITASAWTGAWVISSFFGGRIIENYGFKWVFLIAICLYLLSSALYYFFFAKCDKK